ncbi:MAG TPA: hypothetical protein G4O00_04300 [Thermoflexia bacterium]|jgi:hypothetical protein|nr:hypothetical protein [Thermoflexia bacterium]
MSELRESGLIRLVPRLGRTGAWFLPPWAVLCGAIASSRLHPSLDDGVRLALSVLLVEGGWGTLWSALGTTDWAALFEQWRGWVDSSPVPSIPYAQPGSPAERFTFWLSRLRSWWRKVLIPTAGPALGAAMVGSAVSLLVALALGPETLILTLGVLALMELALLSRRGQIPVSGGWDGVLRTGAPWLVGHLAFGSLTLTSVALAGAFSLAAAGADGQSRRAWIGGQALAALLLISLHQPLTATFLALLLIPQWLLLARPALSNPAYQHALPWLAAAMLLAALAV